MILLVEAGLTVNQIVGLAVLWSYLQKYTTAELAALIKRLYELSTLYPSVPAQDILYLIGAGYTDDDIKRILPYYAKLGAKLQEQFNDCLSADEARRKGGSRVIAMIIALDGNNIKEVGQQIGNTDLDLVLNNNGNVQIGGGVRKAKDDGIDQFKKSYEYTISHGGTDAYMYVEVPQKTGRTGKEFRRIMSEVTAYMKQQYMAADKNLSSGEADKKAADYAKIHVQPIGYKVGAIPDNRDYPYGTVGLNGKPYPPNLPAA